MRCRVNITAIAREAGQSRPYASQQIHGHKPMTPEVRHALARAERAALALDACRVSEALAKRGNADAARTCLSLAAEVVER